MAAQTRHLQLDCQLQALLGTSHSYWLSMACTAARGRDQGRFVSCGGRSPTDNQAIELADDLQQLRHGVAGLVGFNQLMTTLPLQDWGACT